MLAWMLACGLWMYLAQLTDKMDDDAGVKK